MAAWRQVGIGMSLCQHAGQGESAIGPQFKPGSSSVKTKSLPSGAGRNIGFKYPRRPSFLETLNFL
jgi:hypothetical protein